MRSPSAFGGLQHAVAHGVVVGEKPHVQVAQRDYDGAGQGGGIHQVRAALMARVGERVGQDQTAFGIGIDDFDRLAGHRGHDVARPLGAAARHVFHAGNEGRHRHRAV